MKRITDYRKLFGITDKTTLTELKIIYRGLMKQWHPDKFQEENVKAEAELKSKEIIEAYHFLVRLSPETHATYKEEYTATITGSGIDDFRYKGQTLKVIFQDGSAYEYFGVPKTTFNKFINSDNRLRFSRRHIFESYPYHKAIKAADKE